MPETATHQPPHGHLVFSEPVALDVSIIVPTYREAENLPVLVPRIAAALDRAELRGEILIVDDNSPDDTAGVCEELRRQYPVRLEIRTRERGLSSAVVHGMRLARGECLLVMDADLSHPPEKIPDLIAALRTDETDFVIGSRYVAGAGTDEHWGLFRWLNSKVATWMARPLTTARDPMAGFFALRRQSLESAANLDPIGYKIGLELMVKCGCRCVKEVPIYFRDRLHGESKLSLKEQLNYLRHLKRLYEFKLGRLARPLKFVMVGSTGMVIDLTSFSLLLSVLPLNAARALAIWLAMTWNFWLNRWLTFAHARREPVPRQYILFCLSCLLGALVNWSVSIGLCASVPFFDRWKLLAAGLGVVAGTVFNYLLSSRVVFVVSRPPDSSP
jgi:dolichol-phosphate mannosyltransferase